MAKVTITIEDLDNGRFSVKSDPSFETLMKMEISGTPWTGAEGMAFFVLNRIWQEAKNPRNTTVEIPKVRTL